MKRTVIHSILALTSAVTVGTCFAGRAEAMNLGGDMLSGNLIGFADGSVNSETEAGAEFGVASTGSDISQILWSGTESTDSFLVRLFRPEDSAPFATLTGNISSFVAPVQLYDEPDIVDLSFYTLSLDSPLRLDSGGYVLSIQNNSNWGWARLDRGTALFRFDDTDTWEEAAMSSGELDLRFTSDTTQLVPTPALLPGLIGLGITTLRNKRRKEATTET